MLLMIGKALGHYQVGEQLGRGGMGEVYAADDLNLNRKVALKFLPDAFTGDPERMARFEREAKLLASLNHANIAAIYGLEQAEGKRFLVLELVEGETLAQRLGKGPLPVDETLGICKQIADGLEAAHEKGVIHRDLKPANVMITEEDKVKILDFGLAKALSDETQSIDSSQSPTLTEAMTRPGVILGTAAYMSPEQAKGKAVDKRADIWAFGCILYECLTGKKAFEGETVTETLAALLKSEPDWQALPAATPSNIRFVLRCCLEKDKGRRFHHAADLRIEIEDAYDIGQAAAPAIAPRRYLAWAAAAIAGVLLGGAVTGWLMWTFNRPSPPATQRLSIVPAQEAPVAFFGSPGLSLAISPDGTRVAYVGAGKKETQLFVRSLGDSAVRAIPGTEGAFQPFFSPDGQWIAFFTQTELKKVALGGGNPITLTSKLDGGMWCFGEWGDDDIIIFSNLNHGLRRVSADGGKTEQLRAVKSADGEVFYNQPDFIHGIRAVLFSVFFSQQRDPRIDAIMLNTGERRIVVENADNPHYLRSGYLLFQRDKSLLIAPFDAKRLRLTGPAVPLIDQVRRDGSTSDQFIAQLAVSWNGTLAYVPAVDRAAETLGWVSREGKFQAIGLPPNSFDYPRLSPGGKQLAFELQRDKESEVHIYDLVRGTTTRLTQAGSELWPAWRPNGTELAVFSVKPDAQGIYLKNLDGSERLLLKASSDEALRPGSWSPDGTLMAYTVQKGGQHDIWVLTMGDKPAAHPYLNGSASEHSPMFSPDGRWLAYVSNDSGRGEVYVRRYPEGERLAVSTGGGWGPVWHPDGKELFYQALSESFQMYEVRVEMKAGTILPGSPKLLFNQSQTNATGLTEVYSSSSNWGPEYDVDPDGRFVMVKGVNPLSTREIVLVQNWFTELAGKTH
jgi:eukaryotic-like serine/threonine-protein kinase